MVVVATIAPFFNFISVSTYLSVHLCVSQAGFFKRDFQKKTEEEEEFRRDSWDYVPKNDKTESTT